VCFQRIDEQDRARGSRKDSVPSVQEKEACGDLLSGCYTPLRDYPTPFGAERPLHGVEQPLIDQRPNLGIMLQSLDCNTTLSLVR